MTTPTITTKADRFLRSRWYKLDMAGTLYPAIARTNWNSEFRLTAQMVQPVNSSALQKAVDKTLPRFPSMAVKLKAGLFWYYLEENDAKLIIQPKGGSFCQPFRKGENNGFLLRVLFDEHSISVEYFHAITDGTGGMIFLKTLVAEYLRQSGYFIPSGNGVFSLEDIPSSDETADAFSRFQNVDAPLRHSARKAYHFSGRQLPRGELQGMNCKLSAQELKSASARYQVTVTEFLAAVLLYTAYCTQREDHPKYPKPICISIPLNLRKRFGERTIRNYSWFINPRLDARKDYTFKDVICEVSTVLRNGSKPENLTADIAPNRALLGKRLFRLLPLPIKSTAIAAVYHFASDRPVSATMSNLGVIDLPDEMEPLVHSFAFHLGEPYGNTTNCALVTYRDDLMLCFTSNQATPLLPEKMISFLKEQGIQTIRESERKYGRCQ